MPKILIHMSTHNHTRAANYTVRHKQPTLLLRGAIKNYLADFDGTPIKCV